ncbi:unnamed protein product, partial [Symbiodinium microadriaticum]
QAPAWNTIVQRYANHPDVSFGDINLSEQQIRGNHNPGAGGWPTIKYFNKDTGYDGAAYEKKTSKAMCDELGDVDTMEEYVVEAGNIALCSVTSGEGCNEKEKEFIEKWKSEDAVKTSSQLTRLNGMKSKRMNPDLTKWLKQRIAILKQLAPAEAEL